MEQVMCVAKVLYDMYNANADKHMDEMRMQKLMYFAQRESLMINDVPLFEETFYAWRYGPVLKEVHTEYQKEIPFGATDGSVADQTRKLLEGIVERYGTLSPWKLSSLSHAEFSWKKARMKLQSSDDGDVAIDLDAIRVDAVRERVGRKIA